MTVKETYLKGCFIIEPLVYKDDRGYFSETYNSKDFSESLGVNANFVQDNESMSSKGVLRGLHFQMGEFAQAKLVRVVKGSILDVVVDIRPNSRTFGQHFSIELSGENKTQLFISKGFAHGFVSLKDNTIFNYKCDNYYNKESEEGIIYNDPDLNIDWIIGEEKLIISPKDRKLPKLKSLKL